MTEAERFMDQLVEAFMKGVELQEVMLPKDRFEALAIQLGMPLDEPFTVNGPCGQVRVIHD